MVCYAGLIDFEEAVVLDPAVRALAGKVRYVVDPDNPYPRQFTGHLRVTMASGEVREASQGHFRGGGEEPLAAAAPVAKFPAHFGSRRRGTGRPQRAPTGRGALALAPPGD